MRRNPFSVVVVIAVGAGLALFSGCTSVLGDFEVDPNGSASGGVDGGDGDGGGTDAPTCVGNTIDACGATCTKCTAPTGGTVECVSGACQQKCPAPQTACADTCVDTTTSKLNCGKCARDCGGPSTCRAGACDPFPVTTSLTNVHAIAMSPSGLIISAESNVSLCTNADGCTPAALTTIRAGISQLNDVTVAGTDVYFDGNQGDNEFVWKCPVAGCPGAGPTVVEQVVNDSIGRVVAGPSNVLWTRYQSYYGPYSRRCALPGCASIADVRPIPTTGPYYNDPSRENTVPSSVVSVGALSTLWATGGLYNSGTRHLRACSLAGACPTPTEIDTEFDSVSALTFHAGKHYGASSANGGGNVVFSVNDMPPYARTILVADAAGITDVAVDASGIYWVNRTTGRILRCANLMGCAGSGETLALNQIGASRIALDAKFVYWMTPNSVMKVAK